MFTKADVRAAMEKAVANPENQYKKGGINWNFVDADAFMDCNVNANSKAECERFYEFFEEIADVMEVA